MTTEQCTVYSPLPQNLYILSHKEKAFKQLCWADLHAGFTKTKSFGPILEGFICISKVFMLNGPKIKINFSYGNLTCGESQLFNHLDSSPETSTGPMYMRVVPKKS